MDALELMNLFPSLMEEYEKLSDTEKKKFVTNLKKKKKGDNEPPTSNQKPGDENGFCGS